MKLKLRDIPVVFGDDDFPAVHLESEVFQQRLCETQGQSASVPWVNGLKTSVRFVFVRSEREVEYPSCRNKLIQIDGIIVV